MPAISSIGFYNGSLNNRVCYYFSVKLLERFISVTAPHNCLNCGLQGKLICTLCAPDVCSSVPSRCFLCKATSLEFATCKKCQGKTPLKHVWVASEFKDLAKQLVHTFKFQRAQGGASIVANYMFEALPFLENKIIVPVPTASSRVRLRGYDHAKLIAKDLSLMTKLDYLPALSRLGQSRQVGAKRLERAKQLENSFRVSDYLGIQNKEILLVDDVSTTGATLNEAARTLRRAGAKRVNAVVFAQTR